MKTYRVVFDVDAQSESLRAVQYIAQDAPGNAANWFNGLRKAIESLEMMPQRCAHAPETATVGQELRHYIYKSHRIIFRVEEEAGIVRILHVRHGAQRAIGEAE